MFSVLLQAGGNTQAQPNILASLFPFLLIFLIFYFLLIRPQRKKQKEHQQMIDNLKVHDDVITTGGIIGRIVNIKKEKNIVVLRVDETTNAKIEFQRGAIAGVLNEEKKG
jgi:preprotein translocase subunit YajC